MNPKKNNTIAIVILVIVMLSLIYGIVTQDVKATTIKEYEAQIETNNGIIQKIEGVKEQLHTTAELLREADYINGGFDVLLSQKWQECNDYQTVKVNENTDLQNKIAELKNKRRYVGNFKITHYCPCKTCNGSSSGKTASGTKMTPYKTIAVDPKAIPLGSKVEFNGEIYLAEDTGSAIKGKKIDLCVGSHSEAYARGVLQNVPVYIVE